MIIAKYWRKRILALRVAYSAFQFYLFLFSFIMWDYTKSMNGLELSEYATVVKQTTSTIGSVIGMQSSIEVYMFTCRTPSCERLQEKL
jgi:hypothetical protein